MGEQLATADGNPIDLDASDQAFAAAMAAPASGGPAEAEAPAPPRRPPADPEAPYGRTKDGQPKRGPGGRPPKPREIEPPKDTGGKQGSGQKPAGPGYTQQLAEFCEGLWMLGAAIPIPHDALRIRVRCQAAVIEQNTGGIAKGVGIMAEHNGTVRAGVEKITTGSAGWVLPAMFALAPFVVQTAAVWRAPVEGDMRDLAGQVEAKWAEVLDTMKAEFAGEDQEQEQPGAQAA